MRFPSVIATPSIVAAAAVALLLVVHPAIAEPSAEAKADPVAEAAPSEAAPETDPNEAAQGDAEEPAQHAPQKDSEEDSKADAAEAVPEAGSNSDAEGPDAASTEPASSDSLADPEKETERASWPVRTNAMIEQIRTGVAESADADALYHELAGELWAYQDEVYEALRRLAPDALERRETLTEMYNARLRLLDWVTPELRAKMIGGGSNGMLEIGREIDNAKLEFLFQALAIPHGLKQIADGFRESPLDDIWRLFELLFGVIVFRSWRRWAKDGIASMRTRILGIRPRTNVQLQAARLLWYLHRFRSPLEWLALLAFASAIFEPGDLEEVTTLLWLVAVWLLLTRFGLLLVDALASRSVDGPSRQNAALRLRSLRLVASWILFSGLGLDLSAWYVGEGAIHAWVWRLFALLLGPVLLLLLYWWRLEIIGRLKEEARHSAVARRMGKREKGLGSYVNAAAGAVYLVGAQLLQLLIRLLSGFEAGRKVIAMLLRREVERDGQRESIAEKKISDELRLRLLTPDDTVIEGPFRELLARIEQLTNTGRGAKVAVLAERGGGSSTFLRLMQEDLGECMRILDCPPGGFAAYRDALADEFAINRTADLTTELRPRLDELGVRIIAVNNFHRIARPAMGGLQSIEENRKIAEGAGEDIVWIVALTRASWPYIARARGDRSILQEVLELPPWSDEQLEELFEARCKVAGIEPDYRRLVFPRQFDDGERTTLEERNRFGFRRVLWELSDGNPEVAIRLFCDSLRELPSGKLIVRLPQPASTVKLSGANITTLLALRALVECEVATIEDLTDSIRVPRSTIANSIAYCIQEGWVEEVYDQYQITWDWYRPVKRVLMRRNLIAR